MNTYEQKITLIYFIQYAFTYCINKNFFLEKKLKKLELLHATLCLSYEDFMAGRIFSKKWTNEHDLNIRQREYFENIDIKAIQKL